MQACLLSLQHVNTANVIAGFSQTASIKYIMQTIFRKIWHVFTRTWSPQHNSHQKLHSNLNQSLELCFATGCWVPWAKTKINDQHRLRWYILHPKYINILNYVTLLVWHCGITLTNFLIFAFKQKQRRRSTRLSFVHSKNC